MHRLNILLFTCFVMSSKRKSFEDIVSFTFCSLLVRIFAFKQIIENEKCIQYKPLVQ